MSFAPQGGVSEASASRSSHPFRRSSYIEGGMERVRGSVSVRWVSVTRLTQSPPVTTVCLRHPVTTVDDWKAMEVIRKIWEVNLGFHGRFLNSIFSYPSSTRNILSSYLRSSGCRSSTSLSIHLLRSYEGTEVSEYLLLLLVRERTRTEPSLHSLSFTSPSLSPLLCLALTLYHLRYSERIEWNEKPDEDRGEESRDSSRSSIRFSSVISARFLRMSFTPLTEAEPVTSRGPLNGGESLTSRRDREPKRAAYSRH